MQMKPLGESGILVSQICLGTMTWGAQNSPAEGHAQIDAALAAGVNFLDAAEMYPTAPVRAETSGRTEEIIGDWFAKGGPRDAWVLATKIAGGGVGHIRDGAPITGAALVAAVEGSLRRLKTDYIDLYQLHWPNRGHYHFRQQWDYVPERQAKGEMDAHVADVLEAAERLIAAGKIRALGLSNETVWGTAAFLRAAAAGLPRVASVQNEYSLLYRTFDLDFAELAHHEDVGLLAYSPLAAGLLTGKYSGGAVPAGSRASINAGLGGRLTDRALAAADAYADLARRHGLDPATMAVAFCLTRPFMTSAIIGATDLDQLAKALSAAEATLSAEVLEGIAALHKAHPSPY
ncbi:MAG: aldo/keto reductase [Pseudomonadota bacterium]